eukprot:g11489.t1
MVDIMIVLMDAGVVDTGVAHGAAAGWGGEEAVKLLLQQRQKEGSPTANVEYVNLRDNTSSHTPLFRSVNIAPGIGNVRQSVSVRVVHMLVDAGGGTTSAVRRTDHDVRTSRAKTTSTPLRVMLPLLVRRVRKHGLVMAPLFRHSQKAGHGASCDDGEEDPSASV